MRQFLRLSIAVIAAGLAGSLAMTRVLAEDSRDPARASVPESSAKGAQASPSPAAKDQDPPELNLLDAMRRGVVSVQAEGRSDGRMTMSVTNRTRRPLRVVLPPGIVAQGATGQFGGMGGMGGGMMGGMGGGMGGMGGGMGGMGGGMGGMGGGMMGGMRGMGGMGRMAATMPPMMGMMMLGRMIMYFCGDYDSWDMRSLFISMGRMGGMGMGGGMGGGMMGGMGGGMGGMGMGGMGMMSVPPTSLPFADLKPGKTRYLPTRLVSLSPPDPRAGVKFPAEGEKLEITDIGQINDDPRVQKALKRLAADKAATPISQLVMWHLAAGLDWDRIAQLSQSWSNRHELSLARDFVAHLDTLPAGETGRVQFQVSGTDSATGAMAAELTRALQGKIVLGLRAESGIPARPDAPSVAVRVRLSGGNALVQVMSSDGAVQNWLPFGKFTVPLNLDHGRLDSIRLAAALAEGVLNRLVRVQLVKGLRQKDRPTYQLRIENASPLILNGLAAVGTASKDDQAPRVLAGISISPRRRMTVPASEDVVKALGLRHGIRIIALNLSGL